MYFYFYFYNYIAYFLFEELYQQTIQEKIFEPVSWITNIAVILSEVHYNANYTNT